MHWVRVFQQPNSLLVGHVRNLLEGAGVDCDIRNWTLAGGMGDLAPIDCEPEIWVAPQDQARARTVVEQWRHNAEGASTPGARLARGWRCQACGEWHDAPFDCCWQCGHERPDPPS
ncbi:putative signal transducing protein [Kushneria sp. EE4]